MRNWKLIFCLLLGLAGIGGLTAATFIKPAEYDVTNFGADATGSVSSTTAFQNAINAACTAGVGVYIPPGDYLFTTALGTFTACLPSIRGAGREKTLLDFSALTSGAFVTFTGAAGTSTLLTGDAAIATLSLGLTSATGFTSKQYVYVSSTDVCCSHYSTPGLIGEIAYIDTLSGVTATLRGVLADTYLVASGAYATPLALVGPATISGIHFRGPPTDGASNGVQFRLATGLKIVDNWFDNAGAEESLEVGALINSEISGNLFQMFTNANAGRDGYALQIDGTSQDLNVSSNQFYGYGTLDLGYGSAAGPPLSGIARRININHNFFNAATAGGNLEGIESHGACESITVEENTLYYMKSKGIDLGCISATIVHNHIWYPKTLGIRAENLSDRASTYTIDYNDIWYVQATGGAGTGIEVQQGGVGNTSVYVGTSISHNTIVQPYSEGIRFFYTNAVSDGIDISFNHCLSMGTTAAAAQDCIQVKGINNGHLDHNIVETPGSNLTKGIITTDVNRMTQIGNVIDLGPSSSGTGISNGATSSGTSTHIMSEGNIIYGDTPVASTGISNSNNVNYGYLGFNDVSGVTTDYHPSSGTGNVQLTVP